MRITIGQKEMAVLNELNRFEKKANNLNKKPYSEEDKRRIRKICLDNIKRLAGDNGWLFEYRQELSVFIERLQDAVYEDEMFFPSAATPQQAEKFVPDSRLTTDKARAMFDAFEKAGFITKLEDGHLKWANNHSRSQFKYFVEKASDYLNLTGRNRKGNVYCRKPFEDYFDFYKTSTFGIVKMDKAIIIDEIFSSLKQ